MAYLTLQRAKNRRYQLVVREVMGEVVRQVDAQNRTDHERAVEVLKTQGLSFTVPTTAEADRWKALGDSASEDMIAEGMASPGLVEVLNANLSDYRETLD